ncbi:MAG TPA: MlaD family protein [Caulobacteraceae bacterium]|jgi:phospholipid/cholesterol/gamma-HCH transport system substrate-binding protein
MERNANYALVGLISTILLIAMIVFLLWLTNFALSARYDNYDVVFHGAVSGLSRGGDVQFNGIKVGEVDDIKLDAADPNIVHARIKVRSDTPVRQDSTASMESQGITGVNYIQLTPGTPSKPLLKSTVSFGQTPTIQATPGAFSSLLSGGGEVVARAVETLNRINRVLSDDNIQKVSGIISDVQAVTAELRARKGIIADADKAINDADAMTLSVKALAANANGMLNDDGKKTFAKIDAMSDQIQGLATDLRGMVARLQGPIGNFAETGLPRLTSTLATLQSTTRDLDRLINEVEANPRGFITKDPPKPVEVKP